MILLYNIIYVLTWSLTCFSHQVDIIENYYYELSCTQFYCKHPQFPFQNIVQMSKLTKKSVLQLCLLNDAAMNLLKILNKNLKCRLIIHDPDSDFYMFTKTKMHYSDCERSIYIFIFIGSIEHCDQHLCACLLTRVTRRHVSVTWLWRGHGDSVTAAHSNPSPSGGMFAANQVKIITVLRDISMFFSKPYPIF